ncbi:MAG: rRNA maturation RNase YbeY [Oscillospiraceae bacterium]|nr:rRNA maturation RNase YbeY [Oscillospiraceae bacterium]
MDRKINIVFDRFTLQKYTVSCIIRRCIDAALNAEEVMIPCEINVLVTDDQGIRGINRVCRSIDKPTDVLSFPMFQLEAGNPPKDWSGYIDPETGRCPLGDMAISLERAAKQAEEFGHSLRREIGYLTIHSILHLLGYDHLDEGEQKSQMRSREEAIASAVPRMQRD